MSAAPEPGLLDPTQTRRLSSQLSRVEWLKEGEEVMETKTRGWFGDQSNRFPKQPSKVSERTEMSERSEPGERSDDDAGSGEEEKERETAVAMGV